MMDRIWHCQSCSKAVTVAYYANREPGYQLPVTIDCPECASKIRIALPPGTLIYKIKTSAYRAPDAATLEMASKA